MLAIYIHLQQTLICRPAITSVAAAVAGCYRICSTTVNRLISAAVIVSYLKQNSRLSDDNSGRWWKVNPALLPRYMDLTEYGSGTAVDSNPSFLLLRKPSGTLCPAQPP